MLKKCIMLHYFLFLKGINLIFVEKVKYNAL